MEIIIGGIAEVEAAPVVVVAEEAAEPSHSCPHADALRADIEPRLTALEVGRFTALELAGIVDVIEDAIEDAALEAASIESEAEGEETMHEEMIEEPIVEAETEPAPEPKPAPAAAEDKPKKSKGMSRSWFGNRAK